MLALYSPLTNKRLLNAAVLADFGGPVAGKHVAPHTLATTVASDFVLPPLGPFHLRGSFHSQSCFDTAAKLPRPTQRGQAIIWRALVDRLQHSLYK